MKFTAHAPMHLDQSGKPAQEMVALHAQHPFEFHSVQLRSGANAAAMNSPDPSRYLKGSPHGGWEISASSLPRLEVRNETST